MAKLKEVVEKKVPGTLSCGKDNYGCDYCDCEEIFACVDLTDGEGAESHLHLCGDCYGEKLSEPRANAWKRLGWDER